MVMLYTLAGVVIVLLLVVMVVTMVGSMRLKSYSRPVVPAKPEDTNYHQPDSLYHKGSKYERVRDLTSPYGRTSCYPGSNPVGIIDNDEDDGTVAVISPISYDEDDDDTIVPSASQMGTAGDGNPAPDPAPESGGGGTIDNTYASDSGGGGTINQPSFDSGDGS